MTYPPEIYREYSTAIRQYPMKNCHIIPLLVALLLAPLAALTAAESAKPPAKPNILIFLVDDMGYSDIGCFGG